MPTLSHLPKNCVKYFTPGHLPYKLTDLRKRTRIIVCTYLTFSPDGDELLANLGGEQIYLFDINKTNIPKKFDIVDLPSFESCLSDQECLSCPKESLKTNGCKFDHNNKQSIFKFNSQLPESIDNLKNKANQTYLDGFHSNAIELFNIAINICNNSAVLHGNRAAIYLKRGWDGDVYSALRDCQRALTIDSEFIKAFYRLIRCLYELYRNEEALKCLNVFKAKYPDQIKECIKLENDINRALKRASKSKNDNLFTDNRSFQLYVDDKNNSLSANGGNLCEQEKVWRSEASDFKQRFCGHCNTTTDIKEVNFFGR